MIDPSGTCTITNAHQYALTNTIHPHNCPRWQQKHKQLCAMSPQCFTPPSTDVQSTSLQLQFLNTPYANTSKYYHDNFTPMYTPSTPITKKRNKTHAHDEYLYHRWNNNTTNTCIVTSTTMPKLEPRTNNTSNHTHKQQSSGTTAKDDLSTGFWYRCFMYLSSSQALAWLGLGWVGLGLASLQYVHKFISLIRYQLK